MLRIRTLSARLPCIDLRSIREIEQEIVAELDFHIAMRTDENIRCGMLPHPAREAAIARFGDFEKVRQQCRRTLIGERIMWQRLQMVLSLVLLIAVAVLAAQVYSERRDNQESLVRISNSLRQLAERPIEMTAAADDTSTAASNDWRAERPHVVKTVPENGDLTVHYSLGQIQVTFDKPMADKSWSWVQAAKDTFPASTGDVHYLKDGKTCVMPVKLEGGKKYVVWFNSTNFQNFKDVDGRPAEPYLLTFATGPSK
jgi:RNA polymerase sigma-70 factor (ECF subfamily)